MALCGWVDAVLGDACCKGHVVRAGSSERWVEVVPLVFSETVGCVFLETSDDSTPESASEA